MSAAPAGVRVLTPATSANLGPGFDAMGLALDLHDEVEARVRDDGRVRVSVEGEGAGTVPEGPGHLVARAFRAAWEAAGERPPGVELRCRNAVPHGRGLGSSASAITAGVAAAAALAGRVGPDGDVDRDWVFGTAADIEGHPDNVAPCVYGGFTLSWGGRGAWRALRLEPDPRLRPVVCVPDAELSTEAARGLLPAEVPHADAAFTAGRAALLTAAVSGHPELLLEATEDRLHERYRAAAMPESARLAADLRGRDGLAAVVSGAGPTVLVLAADGGTGARNAPVAGDVGQIHRDAVDSIRARTGTAWHIRPLAIDPAGVRISSPRSLTSVEE
ncbi:homoserine kinase [Nocardiopsis suaedae]|uniref:Homoserine kinase n=1 Tax=Nocardiopsis suaedae TaxID=3018444 RepID=A0ABT4TK26_9ACTN|nr:homoserine kinase [Nocardiopsis suaedae]MDA2804477.1 homoserine kinase [Nocardiopsis suaedae]